MKHLYILSLVSVSASTFAVDFDSILLWAGSGQNRAAVVIDFNDGLTPKSYVWGYRWSGSATGEDALRAIVDADAELEADFDFFQGLGASLNTARYLRQGSSWRHQSQQDFNAGRYWSYWESTSGSAQWTFANSGMTGRTLTDGSVDGWSFSDPNYVASAPSSPIPAVSEPMSVAALTCGFFAWIGRRRRSP